MKLPLFALAALTAVCSAAVAGPRDDVVDELVKCADIADNAARLACFDRGTPALRAAAQQPRSGETVAGEPAADAARETSPPAEPPKAVALAEPPPAATQPAPKPTPSDGGGSWFSALNPLSGIGSMPTPTARQMAYQPIGQEILPVTIGVKEFYVPLGGAFMVTLANNQVWRAVHGYTSPPRFREGKTNFVVVDHAMLGGYNLSLYGNSTLYKVERVQ